MREFLMKIILFSLKILLQFPAYFRREFIFSGFDKNSRIEILLAK